MAKAGAHGGGSLSPVPRRRPVKNPANALWTHRDTSTTRFAGVQAVAGRGPSRVLGAADLGPRSVPTGRTIREDGRWHRLPGGRLVRADAGGHTVKPVAWWRWLLKAGGR